MKKYVFELEGLLRLRHTQRDICRQSLAAAVRYDDDLRRREVDLESRRRAQIDELRQMEVAGGLDVEAGLTRRTYVARLADDLLQLAGERQLAAEQIALCRQALIGLDQAVKSFEKLAERRKNEYTAHAERRDALELEEACRGGCDAGED